MVRRNYQDFIMDNKYTVINKTITININMNMNMNININVNINILGFTTSRLRSWCKPFPMNAFKDLQFLESLFRNIIFLEWLV